MYEGYYRFIYGSDCFIQENDIVFARDVEYQKRDPGHAKRSSKFRLRKLTLKRKKKLFWRN